MWDLADEGTLRLGVAKHYDERNHLEVSHVKKFIVSSSIALRFSFPCASNQLNSTRYKQM